MTFSNTFGFDVSYYQGAINFQQMRDYGAKFVILRCGYAARKDIRFDEYMQTAPLYLPVRPYHYYDPTIPPLEQANSVIATLSQYNLRGRRVWLDLEFTWAGAYSAPNHWKIYRDTIRQAGYLTGIYTRATWWDSRVGIYAAEFATDPCWAAQYNTSLTLVPKGWARAMLWQSGTPSVGIAAGVSSQEIDYDLWNDDYDFMAEWGTSPLPPTNGENMDAYQIKAVLNIRTGAGTSFADVGDVLAGDVIWGELVIVSATDKWLKLSGWMRGGVQLSVPASAHVSINTSNTVKIPVTSMAVNSPLIITIDGGATHTSGTVTLLPK